MAELCHIDLSLLMEPYHLAARTIWPGPCPTVAAPGLQAAKADDAVLAAWMERVRGTSLAGSSEPPDSLQTAADLLEPQAQAFWQRSGQPAGDGSAAARSRSQRACWAEQLCRHRAIGCRGKVWVPT